MVNNLVDGISMALNNEFGSEYRIYSEKVEQGFKKPCFFISYINSNKSRKLDIRYYGEYNFDVMYFPNDKNNEEIHNITFRLYEILEYIELDNGVIVHRFNMNSEIVDSVAHFMVSFKFYMIKDKYGESMEDLKVNNKLCSKDGLNEK